MKRLTFHPVFCEVATNHKEGLCLKQLFKNIIKAPV